MWTIIQTEISKLKRKKMMLGIFILTTLLAAIAVERACSISRSSSYMDSFGDLYTMAFKNLATVFLPIVLGMFATSLFFDEHKNDTLKELLIIPVSKGQLYLSKVITMFLLSLVRHPCSPCYAAHCFFSCVGKKLSSADWRNPAVPASHHHSARPPHGDSPFGKRIMRLQLFIPDGGGYGKL